MGREKAAKKTPVRVGRPVTMFCAACLLGGLAARAIGKAPPTPTPHPRASGDPYAALLQAGWKRLELVNYKAARQTFRKVMDGDPAPAQKAEATFALGHLWQYGRPGSDVEEATKLYKNVVAEFKDTPAAPLALMALARLSDTPEYEKDRNRAEARRLYRKLLDDYPRSFLVPEAVLRLAMTYLEEYGQVDAQDAGAKLLTEHLAKHPDNLLAAVMHLRLADLHFLRKEYRQTVVHWVAADRADEKAAEAHMTAEEKALGPEMRARKLAMKRVMDAGTRGGLYFRIAKVLEKHLHDYAAAVTWYGRIVKEIRRDNKYYVSKLAIERCRRLAAGAAARPATAPSGGEGPRP